MLILNSIVKEENEKKNFMQKLIQQVIQNWDYNNNTAVALLE